MVILPWADEKYTYSAATNEIRIQKLPASEKEKLAQQTQPDSILVDTFIANYSTDPRMKPTRSAETTEGDRSRIDIDIPAIPADETNPAVPATKLTCWFDPKTRRMQKAGIVQDKQSCQILFTYLDATFDEIYDFDIPRETTVVDTRPSKEELEIVARLRARSERDFGTYVALVTTYKLDLHGQPTPSGTLELFAETDDGDLLKSLYVVGANQTPGNPSIKVDGWPTPSLENVLKAIKGAKVIHYAAFLDGKTGVIGAMTKAAPGYEIKKFDEANASDIPAIVSRLGIADEIWPSILRKPFDESGTLLINQAKEHPDWIELNHESEPASPTERSKYRFRYIFDPTRDDVSISSVEKFEGNSKTEDNFTNTIQYSEYVQLPSGAWYPTQWTETVVSGEKRLLDRKYSRLQIFEGQTLDESWYRELLERK